MRLSRDPKKEAARKELEELTREYLKRGGKVTLLPSGKMSKFEKLSLTERKRLEGML